MWKFGSAKDLSRCKSQIIISFTVSLPLNPRSTICYLKMELNIIQVRQPSGTESEQSWQCCSAATVLNSPNRPENIQRVFPMMTLIEKLDAISKRFHRDPMEPSSFVRHYEDDAKINQVLPSFPLLDTTPQELIDDMLQQKQIRQRPDSSDPAFNIDVKNQKELVSSFNAFDPMCWGERVSISEVCSHIRKWLS